MHMTFTGERYVPELRGQIYYEHFHRYSAVIEHARDCDVLDIASGEGYGTAALALVARSVIGVDNDPLSVRHAAARYTAMNLDFRVGDTSQIPAADASIDLVVSFETIEHLTDHERMLSEIKRILRPNGRLVISSPNKLVYSDQRSYHNPFHVRELYFHEFRDLLRGFFPEVRVFGQRIFAASAVHGLRGSAERTRWLGPSTIAEAGITALPDPEYFLAICGKASGDALPDLCSVYLDPRDELLHDVRSGGLDPAGPALATPSQAALESGRLDDEAAASERAAAAHDLRAGHADAIAQAEHVTTERDDARRAHGAAVAEVERVTAERDHARRAHADVVAQLDGVVAGQDAERRAHDELAAEVECVTQEREAAQLANASASAELARVIAEREQVRAAHEDISKALAEAVAQAQRVTAERDDARRAHGAATTEVERVALERDHARRAHEDVVVQMDGVVAERDAARRAHADLVAEVERLSSERDAGQLANVDASAELARVSAERDRACREHADAVAEAERLTAERDDAVAGAERLTAERDDARTAHADVLGELVSARDRLHAHAADVSGLLDSLRTSERERGQLYLELDAERTALAELRAAASTQELRAGRVADLEQELRALQERQRRTERDAAQMQLERDNMRDALAALEQAESILQSVLGSRSWRVTEPVRRVMNMVRAGRRAH